MILYQQGGRIKFGFYLLMSYENIFLCFIAKYNAEMYYAVIGLQEHIETSLCVMEAYVPLFFKGALKMYTKMGMEQLTQNLPLQKTPLPLEIRKAIPFVQNETPHKQTISDLARTILATNMSLEYEFYGFVKHRLELQVKSLRTQIYPRNLCSGKPIGG